MTIIDNVISKLKARQSETFELLKNEGIPRDVYTKVIDIVFREFDDFAKKSNGGKKQEMKTLNDAYRLYYKGSLVMIFVCKEDMCKRNFKYEPDYDYLLKPGESLPDWYIIKHALV